MAATAQAFSPADETLRSPGPEEQWSDSFYFGGADPRGPAFYARIGRRPNEQRIEGAAGVWLPDGRFLLAWAREPDQGERIACGPLAFECLRPYGLWRLRLDGTARLFERPEDVATARDRFETVEIEGELRFMAWAEEPLSGLALGGAVAASHYEQAGSVAGSLRIGAERFGIAGRGMRDHSWGVRDWQNVPYWRWFGMVVDPETLLLINNVGTPDGGERAGGVLMLDGESAPIASCETEAETDPATGAQRRFVAHARDELGREAVLTGEAISVVPLRQRRDGRLTLVNEALTRLSWGPHEGVGLSEFLVQVEGDPGSADG